MLDGYINVREWRIWTWGGARWEKQCRFWGGMLRMWNVECGIWNGACGTGMFSHGSQIDTETMRAAWVKKNPK